MIESIVCPRARWTQIAAWDSPRPRHIKTNNYAAELQGRSSFVLAELRQLYSRLQSAIYADVGRQKGGTDVTNLVVQCSMKLRPQQNAYWYMQSVLIPGTQDVLAGPTQNLNLSLLCIQKIISP